MNQYTYEDYFTRDQAEGEAYDRKLDDTVLSIIADVRKNGDAAIFKYTAEFDHAKLNSLLVAEAEFTEAENIVEESFKIALAKAKDNITFFHERQKEESWFFYKDNGVMLGQQVTALDRVGVYVPGGKAAYPSTVLMDIIPAKIAGVREIYMTTPPQADGSVNPYVLVAAKMAGVSKVYKMGGAHAIAALAYGTESVKKVDKIVGPGNAYVARAKKWVFGDVAIDMIAGPSEICVVADETAPAAYVAADLLSQAEHDEDAVPICITFSQEQANAIAAEVKQQVEQLKRKEIAKVSLKNNGQLYVVRSLDEAFTLVNDIAPEHLQLMIQDASELIGEVRHAGAIFIGNYSPEALGDYMAGPNHTLPTSGTAKFSSPLGVYDFMKRSSMIRYSEVALQSEADLIEEIALTEQLEGHAKAITVRKKES